MKTSQTAFPKLPESIQRFSSCSINCFVPLSRNPAKKRARGLHRYPDSEFPCSLLDVVSTLAQLGCGSMPALGARHGVRKVDASISGTPGTRTKVPGRVCRPYQKRCGPEGADRTLLVGATGATSNPLPHPSTIFLTPQG